MHKTLRQLLLDIIKFSVIHKVKGFLEAEKEKHKEQQISLSNLIRTIK